MAPRAWLCPRRGQSAGQRAQSPGCSLKEFKRPALFGFCFSRTQQSLEESYFHQIHFIFKGTCTQGTVQKSASKIRFLTAEHWLETISILRTPPWPGVGREKRGRLETQSNLGKSKQDSVRINYPTASPNLMLTGGKKSTTQKLRIVFYLANFLRIPTREAASAPKRQGSSQATKEFLQKAGSWNIKSFTVN